jgi:hypothetical protein
MTAIWRRLAGAAFAVAAATPLAPGAWAAARPQAGPAASALNGYWNIDDASRRTTARPEYTPEGQAVAQRNAENQARRLAEGRVVNLGTYICGYNGAPFIYTTSEPWALVVTKDEVVQVAERPSMTPRHFYTDGRSWPDLSKMPPSSSGYSIGHWEGDDLVVETRGLPVGGTPSGGLKGPNTIMRERFHVLENGKTLKVAFTIEDPTLLAKPFTLEYTYNRAEPHTYAFGDFCDPHEDNGRTVSDGE